MSLTFSWVRLLVALRPSSWIWFCSSWIIWGKPVDTARSKTYIFAMSEGREKFIMKFTNSLKNIFNTTGNTWFKMQNYRSICKQVPHTFLLIPRTPLLGKQRGDCVVSSQSCFLPIQALFFPLPTFLNKQWSVFHILFATAEHNILTWRSFHIST